MSLRVIFEERKNCIEKQVIFEERKKLYREAVFIMKFEVKK